jgi:hypothetical protein
MYMGEGHSVPERCKFFLMIDDDFLMIDFGISLFIKKGLDVYSAKTRRCIPFRKDVSFF